jgi:hypothetical protein
MSHTKVEEVISERFASIHRFLDRQIAASDPNNPDNSVIYEKVNNIKILDENELYGPQGKKNG